MSENQMDVNATESKMKCVGKAIEMEIASYRLTEICRYVGL